MDGIPFGTMGSGSVCAMSVLEAGFKDDMTKEEAMKLVADAIKAGISNDNASGSNVDLVVITKDGADFFRPYELLDTKKFTMKKPIYFPKGSARKCTELLSLWYLDHAACCCSYQEVIWCILTAVYISGLDPLGGSSLDSFDAQGLCQGQES